MMNYCVGHDGKCRTDSVKRRTKSQHARSATDFGGKK